jgi:cell division protein FtsX
MIEKEDNWDNKTSEEEKRMNQDMKQELAGPLGIIAIGVGCCLLGNSYNIFILLTQIYEYILINGILMSGLTTLEFLLISGGLLGIAIGIAWLASIVIRDSH